MQALTLTTSKNAPHALTGMSGKIALINLSKFTALENLQQLTVLVYCKRPFFVDLENSSKAKTVSKERYFSIVYSIRSNVIEEDLRVCVDLTARKIDTSLYISLRYKVMPTPIIMKHTVCRCQNDWRIKKERSFGPCCSLYLHLYASLYCTQFECIIDRHIFCFVRWPNTFVSMHLNLHLCRERSPGNAKAA